MAYPGVISNEIMIAVPPLLTTVDVAAVVTVNENESKSMTVI
jgi:hypothetical protein